MHILRCFLHIVCQRLQLVDDNKHIEIVDFFEKKESWKRLYFPVFRVDEDNGEKTDPAPSGKPPIFSFIVLRGPNGTKSAYFQKKTVVFIFK